VAQHCQPVGQGDESKREEFDLRPTDALWRLRKVHHQPPDQQRAQRAADQQASDGRPEHIDREPAPAPRAEVVQAEQAEAPASRRKGGALRRQGALAQ